MIDCIPEKYRSRLLYLGKGGSIAYGTSGPDSDIDLRGVYLPTKRDLLLHGGEKAYSSVANGNDVVLWELRHFIALAVKGCPSALELLFYPSDVEVFSTDGWKKLCDIRSCFLGKHLQKTLGGFANSDIRAIKDGKSSRCGSKGAELIKLFGYNTKHAANAIRLLYMSNEVVTNRTLPVRLPGWMANECKAIKNGFYTKDEFLKNAESICNIVDELYGLSDMAKVASSETVYDVAEDIIFMSS